MGFSGAAAIVGAALSIGASVRSQHMQNKAAKSAARASAEAAKRNVTVQSKQADPNQVQSDSAGIAEGNRQTAAKRRQGMASTVNRGGLLTSLVTGRNKLGGV